MTTRTPPPFFFPSNGCRVVTSAPSFFGGHSHSPCPARPPNSHKAHTRPPQAAMDDAKAVATKEEDKKEEEEEEEGESRLISYLRVLAAFRAQCEQEGQYQEAKRAHQQLQRLFHEEEGRRRQLVLDRHATERQELGAEQTGKCAHRLFESSHPTPHPPAYTEQYEAFVRQWDAYLQECERTAHASLQAMATRHAAALEALVAAREEEEEEEEDGRSIVSSVSSSSCTALTTRSSSSSMVRWSKELQEWRRKERLLVKNHLYNEVGMSGSQRVFSFRSTHPPTHCLGEQSQKDGG